MRRSHARRFVPGCTSASSETPARTSPASGLRPPRGSRRGAAPRGRPGRTARALLPRNERGHEPPRQCAWPLLGSARSWRPPYQCACFSSNVGKSVGIPPTQEREGHEGIRRTHDRRRQDRSRRRRPTADFLIVEHGLLKSKHALPMVFAEVDADEQVVRTTLSKELIHDSPKVNGEHRPHGDCRALRPGRGLRRTRRRAGSAMLEPDDPAWRRRTQPLHERIEMRQGGHRRRRAVRRAAVRHPA